MILKECITNFIVEKGGNSIFMKRGEGVGGGRPVVVSTTRGQSPTFCVYTEKKCLAMPVLQKLIGTLSKSLRLALIRLPEVNFPQNETLRMYVGCIQP